MSVLFGRSVYVLIICCLVAITGCTSNQRVSQDFKSGTDFQSYKTFSWRAVSSDIADTNEQWIKNAIEEQLIAKGFKPTTNNPDLLLNLNIIKQQSSGNSRTGVGISFGMPIGRHGALGVSADKLLNGGNNSVGLIILDITAQASNQIIWRGTADDIPLSYFFLRNQGQLQGVLRDLINQFPPK